MGRGSDKDVFTTQIEYATCTFPLMHLICPPNFGQPLFFISPGYNSCPKRNWKQYLWKNLGGGGKKGALWEMCKWPIQISFGDGIHLPQVTIPTNKSNPGCKIRSNYFFANLQLWPFFLDKRTLQLSKWSLWPKNRQKWCNPVDCGIRTNTYGKHWTEPWPYFF